MSRDFAGLKKKLASPDGVGQRISNAALRTFVVFVDASREFTHGGLMSAGLG